MEQRIEHRTVAGQDGTPLDVEVFGRERPLVIVPGSLSVAADWHQVALTLADGFTAFVMNRRGHGPSPDGTAYSFDREVDDVAAVMRAAGPDAVLFGHSFGGALALAHASAVPPAALIVYDPGIRLDEPIGGDAVPAVEEALSHDPEEGLVMGMRRFGRFPEEAIAAAMRSPGWEHMVAMAHTWPREMRGLDELDVSPERFVRITSPTLLLRGGESPDWLRETTARLARTIPDTQLQDLAGQGHAANETAPQAVADDIRAFLAA
ncbi:MAG: alpha/beta hydrolase [Actinobacteria bacterium]|nr:alpha/beta hydrolase [Actinomycetota bacterium]